MARPVPSGGPAPDEGMPPGLPYRIYVLALLTAFSIVGAADRHVFAVLVEQMRIELGFDDARMGLLTGLAFAAPYALFTFGAARLGHRAPRRVLIGLAVTIWSAATILCGAATGFAQALLARIGLGAAQASGTPPAEAALATLFPAHQQGRALAVYIFAPPIGLGLGLWAGGSVAAVDGWRWAFVVAGMPGLILAALVFLTLPAMRQGPPRDRGPDRLSFVETGKRLLAARSFAPLLLAAIVPNILSLGLIGWIPAYLSRSHGMSTAAIGAQLGLAVPLAVIAGQVVGGPLAERLGRRDSRWHLWLAAIATLAAAGCGVAALLAPAELSVLFFALQIGVAGVFAAPMLMIAGNIVPPPLRAAATATLMLAVGLFAHGAALWAIGALSDALRPGYGVDSLRLAMFAALLAALPAAGLFYLASRFYPADLATAREEAKMMNDSGDWPKP